jgi:hypothetical protein
MFLLMRDIRGMSVDDLVIRLHELLSRESETFDTNDRLAVHQQNRWPLHGVLARLTDFVETGSGLPSRFLEYANHAGRTKYEVEHIWADKPERHADEFPHPGDFRDHRNRLGGLLLLPKSFNASFGALPYEEKLPHYNAQNLLARSLTPEAYEHNPGFRHFVARTGLPFRPHERFSRDDLAERQALYRELAKRVWDPERLTHTAEPLGD